VLYRVSVPLMIAAVAACGAATPTATPAAVLSTAPSTERADDWTCGGNLVPPTGWQQETAFNDATAADARGKAADSATRKLVARLCAVAGGTSCDYLTSHVRLWKTGTNGKDVCAMAVIRGEDLAEWRNLASTLTTLDDKLAQAAKELLHAVAAGKRVAIAQVVDMGVPGGLRADWLRTRMERFLAAGATLVDVPKKWAGEGVPPGVDVVVQCKVISRQEQGISTLESLWTASFPDGRHVLSSPVTFPEQAAPRPPREVVPAFPADSPGLSVRLDSHAGSLCAGDRSELWVSTDSPVYVRVFDLYGPGQALVSFPTREQPSVRITPGQEFSIGKFEGTPLPGYESERFLVVAAPTEQALGRFAQAKGECRVSPDMAGQLFVGSGAPPGAKIASTGYRVTSGPTCREAGGSSGQQMADAVQQLPVCQF